MLLTLATTMPVASDLGYLLHKHPDRAQQFSVSSVGTAHVFWPEASAERARLLAAARGRPGRAGARDGQAAQRGVLAEPVRQRPSVRGGARCSRSRSAGCSTPR